MLHSGIIRVKELFMSKTLDFVVVVVALYSRANKKILGCYRRRNYYVVLKEISYTFIELIISI